ncbi:hypothetical protein [Phenylobacterium sp.]|uniref:hypothetical protein n=1 Tax=Phenylobacterium sp. TaxID=1871053 RepID=UPI002E30945F|nr:hypothetical protein [Phenylobacterium sp.]HEX2559204.1 hypothetical protein [Phenylobacterium sp.]
MAKIVAGHADVPLERMTGGTRLWHDLKLAGDDFGDVIQELHRTLGVTLHGDLGDYCPTEADVIWAGFLWWPFKRKKTYRNLSIAELARSAGSGVRVG